MVGKCKIEVSFCRFSNFRNAWMIRIFFTEKTILPIQFTDCSFSNNVQAYGISVLFYLSSSNPITFTRCTFQQINSGLVFFDDCNFIQMPKQFFALGRYSNYFLTRCNFLNNSLQSSLWTASNLTGSQVRIQNCYFYNNTLTGGTLRTNGFLLCSQLTYQVNLI